ncbi:MAG: hypothetical protein GX020_03475 [Firmicutes bacterium]|nr:hypothetical protein [Bacillota bacterium]
MGNVITNDRLTLLTNLQKSFKQATEIKLVVSFVMESGVRLLLPELIEALKRDASIQILMMAVRECFRHLEDDSSIKTVMNCHTVEVLWIAYILLILVVSIQG